MCSITIDELVDVVKSPESKLVLRKILNLLQAEDTLNDLINDLNTAMAKSVGEDKYDILRATFHLAIQAKDNLKKDKCHAPVW